MGRYRLIKVLGTGGMGMVYLAEHTRIGGNVALKMLKPELSQKPEIVQRFFNEARASGAVNHPGIVKISDFDYHTDNSAYIVMELLHGESLEERLRRVKRIPVSDAVRIVRQCASALAAAHEAGIVHRDLKPGNIFLASDEEMEAGERSKILDFGIAKLAEPLTGGNLLTSTGSMMGTPAYMSPEQCRGAGRVDHRSDIYSLACVLFRTVCGRPPFIGEGAGDMIVGHMKEPLPPMRRFEPSVPPALEAIVAKGMAKAPDERYATIAEFGEALRAFRRAPSLAPPPEYDPHGPTQRVPQQKRWDEDGEPVAARASAPIASPGPAAVTPGAPRRASSAPPVATVPQGIPAVRVPPQAATGPDPARTPARAPSHDGYQPHASGAAAQPWAAAGASSPVGHAAASGGQTTLRTAASQRLPVSQRPRRRRLLVTVSASVLVGVVGVAALWPSEEPSEPVVLLPEQSDIGEPSAAVSPEEAAEQEAQAAAGAGGEGIGADDGEAALAAAKRALGEHDWATAQRLGKEILAGDPNHEQAKSLVDTATREARFAKALAAMGEALDAQQYKAAREHLLAIEEGSVVYDQARGAYERAHAEVVEKVTKHARAHACDDLAELAKAMPDEWDEAATAADDCRRAAKAEAETKQPSRPSPVQRKKRVDELMDDARTAAKSGQYGVALRHCNDALELEPRNRDALTICGMAACSLKDEGRAKRYYKRTPRARRAALAQVCLRHGVELEPKQPAIMKEINDPALQGR
ncbi:protein kinase domain-containing protein [Haliangium sp.]|uniref:protein kinase domain-containing protein n=1 Tax=Haliangium sp. TaxID=2663208 RepID=UPI003D10863B